MVWPVVMFTKKQSPIGPTVSKFICFILTGVCKDIILQSNIWVKKLLILYLAFYGCCYPCFPNGLKAHCCCFFSTSPSQPPPLSCLTECGFTFFQFYSCSLSYFICRLDASPIASRGEGGGGEENSLILPLDNYKDSLKSTTIWTNIFGEP